MRKKELQLKHFVAGINDNIKQRFDHFEKIQLSLVLRKPVFGVSDQVRYNPGCAVTEDG